MKTGDMEKGREGGYPIPLSSIIGGEKLLIITSKRGLWGRRFIW
jgi:hypothetical protein